MSEAIIKVEHLNKSFKDVKAVDDLSFTVEAGQVYGFLGQNGSGKSTTIRMLLTLIRPGSGNIQMFGLDLFKHRKEILRRTGAIIEKPDFYRYLTARENLTIVAKMSGMKPSQKLIMEKLDMVGLASRAGSKVKTYSQGMKQRLGIAVALVHDPELIVLDEPMNGLDPQGIADVRNLIIHLSQDLKKTIMISSHLLGEMELVADSMLIINKGKKVVEGHVSELFDPSAMLVELKTINNDIALEKIRSTSLEQYIHEVKNDSIILKLHRESIPGILEQLVLLKTGVLSFHSRHSLEDYFLSLTTQGNASAFKN